MPWLRLDDGFLMHLKTQAAAHALGRFGLGRVLVVWAQGSEYAGKYLTDGYLPREIVTKFHDEPKPLEVAEALVASGLWEGRNGGFQIHDYLDYNPSRASVLEKRESDKLRKRCGIRTESNRNPDGIQSESGRNPEGVHPDSSPRAGARSRNPNPNPNPLPLPTLSDQGEKPVDGVPELPDEQPARPACIATGPHLNHAACGSPCVPTWTHQELRDDLAGGDDLDAADDKLRAWYPTVMLAWKGRTRGERPESFWWARYREWRKGGGAQARAPTAPTPAPVWAAVVEALAARIGRRAVLDWFSLRDGANVRESDSGIVFATEPVQAAYIERHYRGELDAACEAVTPGLRVAVVERTGGAA